jgi:hypothetical protein
MTNTAERATPGSSRSVHQTSEDTMTRHFTPAQIRIGLIVTVCAAQFYTSARDIVETAMPLVHHDLSRAVTFPICIDALILIAALTVAARTGVNAKARRWAGFGRYFGFTATIYANGLAGGIASAAAAHQVNAPVVMGTLFMLIPAVALIVTMELLIHGAQGTPASRKAAAKPIATVTRLRSAR